MEIIPFEKMQYNEDVTFYPTYKEWKSVSSERYFNSPPPFYPTYKEWKL